MGKYFTTGQAAKLLRVSISTLKRWLSEPDLPVTDDRNANGWRLFNDEDIENLREYKKQLKKSGRRFKETTLIPIVKREFEKGSQGK